MTQTGCPSAPARCATAVSTATTRSRLAITAAVSPKSVRATDKSNAPQAEVGPIGLGDRFLQRHPSDVGLLQQERQRSKLERASPVVGVSRATRPGEADPFARCELQIELSPPDLAAISRRFEIGAGRGNAFVQPRVQHMGQAGQSYMRGMTGNLIPTRQVRRNAGDRRQYGLKLRRAASKSPRSAPLRTE